MRVLVNLYVRTHAMLTEYELVPSFAIKGETRTKVFERCAAFINEAHQRIGVD